MGMQSQHNGSSPKVAASSFTISFDRDRSSPSTYYPHAGNPTIPPLGFGHRRIQSEVIIEEQRRNNSLQKWKAQMQKARRQGGSSRDHNWQATFNHEVLANQKCQWYQLHCRTTVLCLIFQLHIYVKSPNFHLCYWIIKTK